MFVISAERPGDGPAIEALLDRAFGPDRHTRIAYRYRRDVAPVPGLGLIALDRGADALVGSIRYWPVTIGAGTPALLLGPLAVAPGRGGEGIGRDLMRQSLDLAQARGNGIVLLVGRQDYYGKFGFRPASPHGIAMPDETPQRLLVAELAPNALAGVGGDVLVRRWIRRRTDQRPGMPHNRVAA